MTVLAGRYALIEQVGEGGMSVVWHARDRRLERDVAIKLLRSFVATEPEQRQRFEREARTLAALTSDHIVRVYDYVDAGEQAFLVMEYVDGGNLAEATFGRLPLSLGEAAAYAAPVAQALAYAHGRGVVHRDLTPTNILIERETGRVLASDFGLARIARSAGSLTAPGVLIGTPEYWSPEQAQGRESDGSADVYALGCILFLLLSGRLPFDGEDRLAVGLRRAHEDAPSLRTQLRGADPDAVSLVDSLLAREPTRRPDAGSTAAALRALADGATIRPWAAAADHVAVDATTVALPSEGPTTRLELVTETVAAAAPEPSRRRPGGRVGIGLAIGAAVIVGVLLIATQLGGTTVRAPNVVSLRESDARAEINREVPTANVLVSRVYSTHIPQGHVIRQQPSAHEGLGNGLAVRLIVSKGTPFAPVPGVAGVPAAVAKAALARGGFRGRLRYMPSWTTRKGVVIGLRPAPGTTLRRPASVTIVVASGYPRAVVTNVQEAYLASAEAELSARHFRSQIVYRVTRIEPTNRVLSQLPAAGATVYRGTRVRLTVARRLRWVPVLSRTGADSWISDPFAVPRHWRIRYQLVGGGFGPPLAQFQWVRNGDMVADGNFFAADSEAHTRVVGDGAGTYRFAVTPYAGTSWSVEVDALE